jgi:hypothetical protein
VLSWLNSTGPAKEGIGVDAGLISLSQYNDPNFPQASKDLAVAIGAGLYSLMDTLPPTDVLLGSIVSLGAANNQQRDIIMVQKHVHPKFYIPGGTSQTLRRKARVFTT